MKSKPLTLDRLAVLRTEQETRREQAKERFTQSVQYKCELAAHILRGEDSQLINADIARVAYYNMYAHYYHTQNPTLTKTSERANVWVRVADCCKLAQVSPGRYMQPMFEFYHRAFGRAPKPHELTTEKAVARVRNYYDKGILECADVPAPTSQTDSAVNHLHLPTSLKKTDDAQTAPSHPASPPSTTSSSTASTYTTLLQTEREMPLAVAPAASSLYVPIPKSELFVLAEQQIQRIMRRQKMTREEVYRTLVIPGDVYLPAQFMKQDPAYQRALRAA